MVAEREQKIIPCLGKCASNVWLVVSSFRNDMEITFTLSSVQSLPESLFKTILIVDSLGTDRIPELIYKNNWRNVVYKSYDYNLGSAGNLTERLRLAATGGADFAYALNHDGHVQVDVVRSLLRLACTTPKIGACYPLGYMSAVEAYNLTGTRSIPFTSRLVKRKPQQNLVDVWWSSSNGALYSLTPVRSGLLPWSSLWMGWEDLEYGYQLSKNGYKQVLLTSAVFEDNYEYRPIVKQSRIRYISNKPAWTAYYIVRNLLLIARKTGWSAKFVLLAAGRVSLEAALILTCRSEKKERLRCMFHGLIDGVANRAEKWKLPRGPETERSRPTQGESTNLETVIEH